MILNVIFSFIFAVVEEWQKKLEVSISRGNQLEIALIKEKEKIVRLNEEKEKFQVSFFKYWHKYQFVISDCTKWQTKWNRTITKKMYRSEQST